MLHLHGFHDHQGLAGGDLVAGLYLHRHNGTVHGGREAAVASQVFGFPAFTVELAGDAVAFVEQHQFVVVQVAVHAQAVAVDDRLQVIVLQAGLQGIAVVAEGYLIAVILLKNP